MSSFGFDVVDIEGVVQELSSLEFRSGGSLLATVNFSDFTDNSSMFYDASISFGNNSANRVQPITASQLGISGFDEVVINVGGSSAFDRIVVPAPASCLLALAGLAIIRRR